MRSTNDMQVQRGTGRRAATLMTLGVLAAAGLTACGGSEEDSGTKASGTTSGKASGKGLKTAFVGLYNGPYITSNANGARAAVDEVGAEINVTGPTSSAPDPTAALNAFQNAVGAGAKVAVVMAYPSEQWVRPVDAAAKRDVTSATTDNFAKDSAAKIHLGTPKAVMGAAMADAFAKQLPEDATGTVYPGLCVPGLAVLEAPIAGFTAQMKKILPGVTVAKPTFVTGDPTKSFANWQRLASQHDDALGFFGVCDTDLPALAKLKSQSPKSKWLVGVAAGADDVSTIDAVKSGQIVGAVSQRGYVQGYVAMKLLLQEKLEGRKLPQGWINSGFDLVTKDNVDQIKATLNDPKAAASYYKGLIDRLIANPEQGITADVTKQLTDPTAPNPDSGGATR